MLTLGITVSCTWAVKTPKSDRNTKDVAVSRPRLMSELIDVEKVKSERERESEGKDKARAEADAATDVKGGATDDGLL